MSGPYWVQVMKTKEKDLSHSFLLLSRADRGKGRGNIGEVTRGRNGVGGAAGEGKCGTTDLSGFGGILVAGVGWGVSARPTQLTPLSVPLLSQLDPWPWRRPTLEPPSIPLGCRHGWDKVRK